MSALFLAAHGHTDFSSFTTMEWIVVGGCGLFVAWTIWRAVVLTVRPGEQEASHIKRVILEEPKSLDVALSLEAEGADPRGGTP